MLEATAADAAVVRAAAREASARGAAQRAGWAAVRALDALTLPLTLTTRTTRTTRTLTQAQTPAFNPYPPPQGARGGCGGRHNGAAALPPAAAETSAAAAHLDAAAVDATLSGTPPRLGGREAAGDRRPRLCSGAHARGYAH